MPNQNEQNISDVHLKFNNSLRYLQVGLEKRLKNFEEKIARASYRSSTRAYVEYEFKEKFNSLKEPYRKVINDPDISSDDKRDLKKKAKDCKKLFKQLQSSYESFIKNFDNRFILHNAKTNLENLRMGFEFELKNIEKKQKIDNPYHHRKIYALKGLKKWLDSVKELCEEIESDFHISPNDKSEVKQKLEECEELFNELKGSLDRFNKNNNHPSSTSHIASLYSANTSSSLNDTLGPGEKAIVDESEFLDSQVKFYLSSESEHLSISDEVMNELNKNPYILNYIDEMQTKLSACTYEQTSLSCHGELFDVDEPLDLSTHKSSDRDALELPKVSPLSKRKMDEDNQNKRKAKNRKGL